MCACVCGGGVSRGAIYTSSGGNTHVFVVEPNVHKHIQHLDDGGVDGDEATVAVVHHEVGSQRLGTQVIDATCAVRHLGNANTE